MNRKYSFFLLTLFVVAILGWTQQTSAQSHNLVVSWETTTGSGLPLTNALYNAVMGDTNADGSRKDLSRVYILEKGGLYQNSENFQNKDKSGVSYPLNFIGQSPNPADAVNGNPAVLQMITRLDGSANGKILTGYGDVYFKNIYVIGSDDHGVQTYYQPLEFEADNAHCVFDSCYFERSNFALTAWNGKNNEIKFTNCKWMNLVERPVTQQWTGRAISCWADQDSVIIENCTFQNIGMCCVQIEGGSAKYFRFVHNTLVNVGRSIHSTSGNWWRDAYFADNLLINNFFDGEGWGDYSLQAAPSRNTYFTGLMAISHLPDSYGPDLGRRIVFANTASFLAQTFKKEWADSVRMQPFFNSITDSFFTAFNVANTSVGGHMYAKDTTWLSKMPNFTKFDTSNYTNMIHFIEDIRAGISPAPSFMQDLYVSGVDTFWTAPQWPIAQNFGYTDNLTGTDGLPLGDLNWFPAKLATWNTNSAQYIQAIQDLAGKVVIFVPGPKMEAESGTVSGTAVKTAVSGLTWYDYTGSGTLTWTFNAPTAGVYDTKWYVNETGRGQSGPNLAIDGIALNDKAHGWGQFIFDPLMGPSWNMPTNSWIWVPITADTVLTTEAAAFTLTAGSHTIGVTGGGWGEMKFSEVDVNLHGSTDVIKLTAPNAVPSLVLPGADGVKWVASAFNYVAMGTNGTVSFSVNAAAAGGFALGLSYQNVHGTQSGSISVDGGSPLSISLPGNTDSSSIPFISGSFQLSQGAHTVAVTAGNVNIDYVVLNQVTGIRDGKNSPVSFALEQNYPNPFNPTTNINFSLPKATNVELSIYNILGQKVMTLISGAMSSGVHSVQFNASHFASGVYIYRLEAGDVKINKKMVLLK
jgi:hypothetical protein